MKRRLLMITMAVSLLIANLLSTTILQAQANKLPPFKMMQVNGKVFRAQNLPLGKPIVIIYFSPECDHCEKMMKELLKKEASFKKASVAMITYLPVSNVAKFVQQYGLNKYSNIYIGTEGGTFFVRNYYKIEHMPFIALHDKDGSLVKEYRKEGPLTDLINQLNKLKSKPLKGL